MNRLKTNAVMEAMVQAFDESDLLTMISAADYNRLRQSDPKPEFRAYTVAHDGVADVRMRVDGESRMTARAVQFFRDAVRKIHDRLNPGIKLFHGHNADSSHHGRQTIGEVVGKAIREIGGQLHDVAVVYIEPAARGLHLDVASIEADLLFTSDDAGRIQAVDVQNITGIALGSSAVDRPAFPGAKLLATVQAFAGEQETSGMDKEQLRKAVQDGGFKPSDLFDQEALVVDPAVKTIASKEAETMRKAKERIEQSLGSKLDEAKDRIKALEGQVAMASTSTILDEIAQDRKLTEKELAFIRDRIPDRFKPESTDPEKVKIDLQKHVDAERGEYAKFAERYFGKPQAEGGETPDGKGKPNTDAADGGDKKDDGEPPANVEDMTKPENNPLIPR